MEMARGRGWVTSIVTENENLKLITRVVIKGDIQTLMIIMETLLVVQR
ncbi:hypothetical protein [Haloplasma contractile]|nr:hypothetical protein [Haloplasma contractile]